MDRNNLLKQFKKLKVELLIFDGNFKSHNNDNIRISNILMILILLIYNICIILDWIPLDIKISFYLNIIFILILFIYYGFLDNNTENYIKEYCKILKELNDIKNIIKIENNDLDWVKIEYREVKNKIISFKNKYNIS